MQGARLFFYALKGSEQEKLRKAAGMTEEQLRHVKDCVRRNDMHAFYDWPPWGKIRRQVLALDKFECQRCKEHGRYERATVAHHQKFVRKYPELALDIWYVDATGKRQRNIISLCNECHEIIHGRGKNAFKNKKKKPLTVERWD